MYNNLNDYEQLYLIKENDDYAKNNIFEKYKPIIVSIAKKYQVYSNYRYDIEDFIQEGYIGLNKAIDSFTEEKEVLFYTFALVCIERQIQAYYRKINTLKNYYFNNSSSLDLEYEGIPFINLIPEENNINDPFTNSITDSLFTDLIVFKNNLSLKKSYIFELRCNGFKYKEISKLLDIPVSIVDNYIHAIKKELYGSFTK